MPLNPLSSENPVLSFADAMEHATIKTPVTVGKVETMDWEGMHAKLAAANEGSTQRMHLARMALEAVRQGVNELAALGHVFELRESSMDSVMMEYPKALYHDVLGERTVNSQREEDMLRADGWDVHPSLRS